MKPAIADVGGLYPDRSGPGDFLTYSFGLTKGIGAHMQAVKLWLSNAYATSDYIHQTFGGSYTTLAQLAADTAFAAIWGDSQVNTYLLGTFTFTDGLTNQWLVNGCPPSYLAAVKQEIQDLCTYLLTNFSGKTFVIQNWEGDWALMGNFVPTTFVSKDTCQSMAAWFRARRAGVDAARAAVPSSTSTVLMAVEVNRSFDPVRRVVRDVLPYINPDLVSVSAYECINPAFAAANMTDAKASIDSLLRAEVAAIRQVKPNTPIYIGEYGWPLTEQPGFWDMGAAIQQVFDTCNALALNTWATWWNILDNSNPYRGYGLYDQSLVITPAGTKYGALSA
jgi:hypothetical protein